MLEQFKANILFDKLLKRPDIEKAYAMVPETDCWYQTIRKVHDSLDEIKKHTHEMLEIRSRDDLSLKAIYYPGASSSRITVICVHGYTSHAEREWAFPGLFYLSLGYNVLIPYQRAHGLSEGKYLSFGALERLDMLGWIEKINEMNPGGEIVIHGLSMGGGIVLDLSGMEMKNVKCLIADAPSCSVAAFFRDISGRVFKKGAEKIASCANERFKKEFGYDVKEFERVEMAAKGRYPLLLAAGSKEQMENTFESIQKANPHETEMIILPGCDHGNGMYKQTELFQETIRHFLARHLSASV
ncbi:MAG: alpha/beta fold hydrolase [Clostridia bacterium]|nr:alpha/beta fold hydrolase [Clostridia bacterium]